MYNLFLYTALECKAPAAAYHFFSYRLLLFLFRKGNVFTLPSPLELFSLKNMDIFRRAFPLVWNPSPLNGNNVRFLVPLLYGISFLFNITIYLFHWLPLLEYLPSLHKNRLFFDGPLHHELIFWLQEQSMTFDFFGFLYFSHNAFFWYYLVRHYCTLFRLCQNFDCLILTSWSIAVYNFAQSGRMMKLWYTLLPTWGRHYVCARVNMSLASHIPSSILYRSRSRDTRL